MNEGLYHEVLYLTVGADEAAIIRTIPSMIRISRGEKFIHKQQVRPAKSKAPKSVTLQQENLAYIVPPTTRKPIGGMWPVRLIAIIGVIHRIGTWNMVQTQ